MFHCKLFYSFRNRIMMWRSFVRGRNVSNLSSTFRNLVFKQNQTQYIIIGNKYRIFCLLADSQVVSHVFRTPVVHHIFARCSRNSPTSAPSCPPCGATWHVLLYYHWLAKLPVWGPAFLVRPGNAHREIVRGEATYRRHGVGQEGGVVNAVNSGEYKSW